jgi:hypothetical protein
VLCNVKCSLFSECGAYSQMSDSPLQRSFRSSSFRTSYLCLASRADEFCIHFSDFIPVRVLIRLTFLNYLGCSFFVVVCIYFLFCLTYTIHCRVGVCQSCYKAYEEGICVDSSTYRYLFNSLFILFLFCLRGLFFTFCYFVTHEVSLKAIRIPGVWVVSLFCEGFLQFFFVFNVKRC